MNLWGLCFIFTPTVGCMDASHRQLGQTPSLQRALSRRGYGRCGYRGAMSWQQVAGEVKDVASVDRPLAFKDGLADVIHPVDHHSILRGGGNRESGWTVLERFLEILTSVGY